MRTGDRLSERGRVLDWVQGEGDWNGCRGEETGRSAVVTGTGLGVEERRLDWKQERERTRTGHRRERTGLERRERTGTGDSREGDWLDYSRQGREDGTGAGGELDLTLGTGQVYRF